jgi:hypothetical protein
MPAADIPHDNTSPNQRFVIGEEEMADISLATFHVFDKENLASGVQVAYRGPWLPRLPCLRGGLRGRQLLRVVGILPRVLSFLG